MAVVFLLAQMIELNKNGKSVDIFFILSDTVCRHRLKEDQKFAPPNILCQKHPHLYRHNYE